MKNYCIMKSWTRVFLLTSLLALPWICAFPQESAFEVLLDYDMNSAVTFCKETADGHFLVVPGKCMVLKLSAEGEVVDEMTYELEGVGNDSVSTYFCGWIDIPDNPTHHIAIAESYNEYTQISNVFHIVRFDDDLNYDPDEVIVVDLSEEVKTFWVRKPPRFLLDEDGNVCLAAHAVKWDGSDCLLLARISPNGDKTVVLEDRFNNRQFIVNDFCVRDSDNYGMVIGIYRFSPAYENKRGITYFNVSRDFAVDSVFCFATGNTATTPLLYNQTDSIIQSYYFSMDGNVMSWISDSVFLFPTIVVGVMGASTNFGAAIWKLDERFDLLGQVFFDVYNGKKIELIDTWNPIVVQSDEIYFCYTTYRGSVSGPMQTIICKLDTDLNLRWKRWYGGANEFHYVHCMEPTSDGGCLLTGDGHPNPSHYNDPYPYVLKITSDGYCSISENQTLLKPYDCYPNPVEDILQVEYSPDVNPKAVELYDLQGRLISTQHNNFKNIGMENLPAGTYTLRIIMKGGENFTEKVVKAH
jgi:hypothetical protein